VLAAFRQAGDLHGYPASTLTDNGVVFTTRYSGGRGGRNHLEHELRTRNIVQKNSRPNHPTTCGKVERFQQTMKTWLTRQPEQPATLEQLQALLDRFSHEYNTQRPHRSLHRRTPTAAYTARPKATPAEPTDRTHARIRHDKINNGKITLRHAGTLYSIGLGRRLTGRPVIALVHDLDITILDATTGELLRELTLDPTRKYQPQQTTRPEP